MGLRKLSDERHFLTGVSELAHRLGRTRLSCCVTLRGEPASVSHRILGIPLYPCIDLCLAMLQQIHCIRCIPLHPTVSGLTRGAANAMLHEAEPSPGVNFWDLPPVFHLYPACISRYPWYPAVSLLYLAILQQIHCIPLYPTVIQLYPYVASCIQLYLLYPAVFHRISPPRKRDMAKNTLQGGARAYQFQLLRDPDEGGLTRKWAVSRNGGPLGRIPWGDEVVAWPFYDFLSLQGFCARINRPFILPARLHCPHCFNTIARLLGNVWPLLNLHNINNNNIV